MQNRSLSGLLSIDSPDDRWPRFAFLPLFGFVGHRFISQDAGGYQLGSPIQSPTSINRRQMLSQRDAQTSPIKFSWSPLVFILLALLCLAIGIGANILLSQSTYVETSEGVVEIPTHERLGTCTVKDGVVFLTFNESIEEEVEIEIKHFGGEVVYRRNFTPGGEIPNLDLDVSFLPEGLFMLKAQSGNKKIVRLIKRPVEG